MLAEEPIKVVGVSQTDCYVKIQFDQNCIECSPAQEFYVVETKSWKPAYQLHVNDILFSCDQIGKRVTDIEFINEPIKVYMLEIAKAHTFFVGFDSILRTISHFR